jgi:hypothetical protein
VEPNHLSTEQDLARFFATPRAAADCGDLGPSATELVVQRINEWAASGARHLAARTGAG